MRRAGLIALLLALCVPAPPAVAAYRLGADLASASPDRREQGDAGTTLVDMSQDGRHVVFETKARNFFSDADPEPPGAFRDGGLFRRDLATGALDLVAYGDVKPTSGPGITFGAHNPSISANGQWVAFSTAARLTTADTNTKVDVYVRDMTRPVGDPAAYELVSARDGGDTPASYALPTNPNGAAVTPGSAISADGRMVVFRTRVPSDLPALPTASVPFGQIFVRDRQAKTTTLVTRAMEDGTPVGGAADAASPAGISADGSTVVWAGVSAQAQTPFLTGEPTQDVYYLWRRVADGPSAPTRRITGVVDLDDPQCPQDSIIQDDPNALGPCYGPLAYPEGIPTAGIPSDKLPALSADGSRVAFLVSPYPRPTNQSGRLFDVYVTDMSPGVSRKAGTIELTQETLQDQVSVQNVAISGDGRRIAIVTSRTVFALPSPRLTTPPPVRSADESDIYVIDLQAMEIARVTFGYDGTAANGSVVASVGALSMSHDASRIAFTASASNLFFGDNNSATDAFVLSEVDPADAALRAGTEPPFPELGPPREQAVLSAPSLHLKVRRRGALLRVTVRVPGAGRVAARARGRVRPRASMRTMASGRAKATRAGLKSFTVRPISRFLRALRRRGEIRTSLVVTFTPSGGGAPLSARRTVSLRAR